MFPMLHCLLLY